MWKKNNIIHIYKNSIKIYRCCIMDVTFDVASIWKIAGNNFFLGMRWTTTEIKRKKDLSSNSVIIHDQKSLITSPGYDPKNQLTYISDLGDENSFQFSMIYMDACRKKCYNYTLIIRVLVSRNYMNRIEKKCQNDTLYIKNYQLLMILF